MQALPHAFPTVQTSQHFSRGMHVVGASILSTLDSAEDGMTISADPTTTVATTRCMRTPMLNPYARRRVDESMAGALHRSLYAVG
jgi:hypothetical protein